jgi:hypothetical protein
MDPAELLALADILVPKGDIREGDQVAFCI